MVIVRIKMVCSNITVDNNEAGFKHNSNEVLIILTAVVAFGNVTFGNEDLWPNLSRVFPSYQNIRNDIACCHNK